MTQLVVQESVLVETGEGAVLLQIIKAGRLALFIAVYWHYNGASLTLLP